MQNVKEQRLQKLGRIAPAREIECLKRAERERVLGIVEEKPILSGSGPAVQTVFQLANNVGEIRERPLTRFEEVDALDGVP